jgi:hypothetical protein
MEWIDEGCGSESAEKCWESHDLVLQVVNVDEDTYNFMIDYDHPKGKPWRGELLIDFKVPPFRDQTNPICLLTIYSQTKEKCKEDLVTKSETFFKKCQKAVLEMVVE